MSRSALGPGRNDPKREPDNIVVEGAREHNLVVDRLELPKHRLVVITGPSGSGKASPAFDTLYAEGQRRYVESLSAYARQFLGQMEKPKYERIRGLSPTIAIQQKSASSNPRSTVGTITEIYDYLRVLYARAGGRLAHPPDRRRPRPRRPPPPCACCPPAPASSAATSAVDRSARAPPAR